ncbi:MAG: hypothetical protein KDN22_08225 [Verrucomicrobiae bacterium]|nr:hypothetical protein [Verrucomicrobiae bacterium]
MEHWRTGSGSRDGEGTGLSWRNRGLLRYALQVPISKMVPNADTAPTSPEWRSGVLLLNESGKMNSKG